MKLFWKTGEPYVLATGAPLQEVPWSAEAARQTAAG